MATIPIGFGGGGGAGSDDVTATKNQVLKGYTAITSDSDNEPIEGTIPIKAAATYDTSPSDQTIPAGRYLGGAQTIRAVTTENIDAANIKKGVVVKVGDTNNDSRIKNVTGTYTNVTGGKTAAGAGQILAGYAAYANGSGQIDGTIAAKPEEVYYPSTSDQEIAAGLYTSGKQTIKAVKTSNIEATNIKSGVTVQVGDEDNPGRIRNIAGTYSTVSGKSAIVAGAVRSGYAGFANGSGQINGTIADQAGGTYTPGTSNQTIANAGRYLTSNVVMKGDANLVAGNILSGKSIFGVAGNVRKYAYYSQNVTSSSTSETYSTGVGNKSFYYLALAPGFTMLATTAAIDGSAHFCSMSCSNYGVEVRENNDGNGYFCNMNPQGTSVHFPVTLRSRAYKTTIAGYY